MSYRRASGTTLVGKISLGSPSVPGRLVSIGTYGSAAVSARNASTTASLAGWMRCPFPIMVNCTDLRFAFGHFLNQGSTGSPLQVDSDPTADLVGLKASVIIGSTVYPLSVGGKQVFTVSPGSIVYTDPLPVEVTAGTIVHVFTYVPGAGNGNIYYATRYSNSNASAGGNGGGGLLQSTDPAYPATIGAVPDTQTSLLWTTMGIFGTHLDSVNPVVLIVGDSQAHGQGEVGQQFIGIHTNNTLNGGGGFVLRALHAAGIPALMCAIGGDKASIFKTAAGYFRRTLFANDVTTVICHYGRNDVSQGDAATTIQANLISVWKLFSRRGKRVIHTTIINGGGVTSTDGYWTVENQTVGIYEANRVLVNSWLRDGAPYNTSNGSYAPTGSTAATTIRAGTPGHPLYAIFDVAPLVESSLNSGKWLVPTNVRTVTDVVATNGSPNVSSATAAFTSADVGRRISVAGAGAAGVEFQGTIMSISSSTSVVCFQAASTTVSGATAKIGDDMTRDGTHPGVRGHILLSAGIDVSKIT